MGKLEGKIALITGGRAFVRADMDNGLKGSPHSRERSEPGLHRHPRTE